MKKLFIALSLLLVTASATFAGNLDSSSEAGLPFEPVLIKRSVMSGTVVNISLAAYQNNIDSQLPMFFFHLNRTYTVPVTLTFKNRSTGSTFTTVVEAGNNSGWVVVDYELGNWSISGRAGSERPSASGSFTISAPVGMGYVVGSVVLN
ncbi:MAG: hypothetical protein J6W98_04530 [Bacteroidales bacterium]|nr:hypothetical protein [Bacteroidales bacterium]